MLNKIANAIGWPWLCRHDYQIVNKVNIYTAGKRMPVGKEYHMVCTKCASLKRKRI